MWGKEKWKAGLFWGLLCGCKLLRANAVKIASQVESLLITDSRRFYDCLSNSDSPLLGMSHAKSGIELMGVQSGLRVGSNLYITWVLSDPNISDALTKVNYESLKPNALWFRRRTWVVRFHKEFIICSPNANAARCGQAYSCWAGRLRATQWQQVADQGLGFV